MTAGDLEQALRNARGALLRRATAQGSFSGRLSASALSTATASIACTLVARLTGENDVAALGSRGRAWLRAHQNADGGFGDTADSPSNISTTTLCHAALGLEPDDEGASVTAGVARWLAEAAGGGGPADLAAAIRARYGRDHTFSVPILMTAALCGRLGEGTSAWRLVPHLPFELAALPQKSFSLLRLPMVSYALPALVAIGQVIHHHRPTRNPLTRAARALARRRTLRVLERIQPESGGFLEATPLTSFVLMSLAGMQRADHPVARGALAFLRGSVRADGSWPIDSNLDTWTTTLAVQALGEEALDPARRAATRDWLLRQQYREVHPYTLAAPGGWAWTDLPGGVPDADDTPGALLALHALCAGTPGAELQRAARLGVGWLLDLQNRDGGIPTFCRGWGLLPFDRSSPDLTAHALRAWQAWRPHLPAASRQRVDRASARAAAYLLEAQGGDGAWVPLWFGNQHEPREENPLYGTSRVLRALCAVPAPDDLAPRWRAARGRALDWLLAAQHADGGFGGAPGVPPSVEETALGVEALARALPHASAAEPLRGAVTRGAAWLVHATGAGERFEPAPIGLYFAKLWYSERLYPLIFTTAALAAARRALAPAAAGESDPCLETA